MNTDLPWSDCKVAFSIEDADPFDQHGVLDGRLPNGWELDEVDGTGARWVVIFRVMATLTVGDGRAVAALLIEVGANPKPTAGRIQRDDFVVHKHALVPQFGVVVASGPTAYDVVWIGGSTSRYRHADDVVRVATDAEVAALGDITRTHLLKEAAAAREERRTGAGVRRGEIWP